MTRYELLDRIGVGGMAEIFRGKAVAAGGFEKPVAIKRILPHLSQDKRFVELLIAEAKVLSLLKHRNIVQIFDVGLGDDGQYFLVMEYVDGKDLGAVQRGLETRRARMPFDLALHIAGEICEALEHAHSARAPDGKSMSLVHRDVSPSNVLMSRAGEVKLTDFGIAKRAEQEATGHGAVRGKFAYISPEQARNEHLEPRSDVFSVGILLWELVTGRRLFSGLGDMEALRSVREAQIPRPRDVDGRLSAEIDALIGTALSRDPQSRPTAGQLGQKLRTLRYSLEATVGDPATELAKIIDDAAELESRSAPRISTPMLPALHAEPDGSEATVIRIHTADEFSSRDDGGGVARARQVIDRFEEEETRQAQLSRDQMAFLRSSAVRDSGELTSAIEPPLPGVRPRQPRQPPTDEQTRARALEDAPTFLPDTLEPSQQFEAEEATRLVAPISRRTPPPERIKRPPTQPPPQDRPERSAERSERGDRKRRPSTQPPPQDRPERSERADHRFRPPTQHPPKPLDRTPDPMRYTPPPGTMQSARGLPPTPPPSGSSAMAHPPLPAAASQPALPAQHPSVPVMQPPPMAMPMPLPLPRPMPQPAPGMAPPQPQLPMMPPSPMLTPMPPRAPMLPPAPQPGLIAPQMPGGNYATWGAPQRPSMNQMGQMGGQMNTGPVPDLYERQVPQRPSVAAMSRPRRTLKPWMLVIGALVMALLAFAVTRAFIHTATKPTAETK
ncbi:MAG TPA: protein kinase [Kofleriaceae bacterium]|nr:protein kinase [Kofleriaceae bacterium]